MRLQAVEGLGRRAIRCAWDTAMRPTRTPFSPSELQRPAVVIAPHYDDEILGCGGLIALKRRAGARMNVIFMTDGTVSHARWLDAGALGALRRAEGEAAVGLLGVRPRDVIHFGFPEDSLELHVAEAAEALTAVLSRLAPMDVFATHRLEPPSDHRATFHAAHDAVSQLRGSIRLYQYPVWLWSGWPWTRRAASTRRKLRHDIKRGVDRMMLIAREFNHCARIGDVLGLKHAALLRHQTQMVRLDGSVIWPILADVDGGEWLARFFTGIELFALAER